MLELAAELVSWRPAVQGVRCAIATVVRIEGSAPRPIGTSMVIAAGPEGSEISILGSLSGGCIEGAVASAALEVLEQGGARHEKFSYSPDEAFAVGLTCGGEIEVRIQELPSHVMRNLTGPAQPIAVITLLTEDSAGHSPLPDNVVVIWSRDELLTALQSILANDSTVVATAKRLVEELLTRGDSGVVQLPASDCEVDPDAPRLRLLIESSLAPPRFLIVGANDFGAALVPVAKLLGYDVTLIDARQAFAEQERFTEADEVVVRWPHEYLSEEAAAGRVDPRTVLCVLAHDPKFDTPILDAALRLDLAYIGAMGSHRSHRARTASLADLGHCRQTLSRLHSPIGLDVGALTPPQVAVSIAAEIIAGDRRGRLIARLSDSSGPIHKPYGRNNDLRNTFFN